MPYIITTIRPDTDYGDVPEDADPDVIAAMIEAKDSRRAVATLEEAREAVSDALYENGAEPDSWRLAEQFDTMPESGGTIGPLPDGTMIEVERAGG